MRKDLTDITVVMDRSGSMASCQKDAEGGINTFIEEQKKHLGQANFTLVQFDTHYEFVYKASPIGAVGHVTLVPRGGTALLDAVGKAIAETGERLAAMSEHERPGLVVFLIVTDGQENASREYTKAQIKSIIEQQQSVYNWSFIYLGANQDAFHEAQGMGITATRAATYNVTNTSASFNVASDSVLRSRSMSYAGNVCDPLADAFSKEERKTMVGGKQ